MDPSHGPFPVQPFWGILGEARPPAMGRVRWQGNGQVGEFLSQALCQQSVDYRLDSGAGMVDIQG